MRLIEGHEYATIKNNRIIIIDGDYCNWIPDTARTLASGVPPRIRKAYLSTVFKVETRKPYPMRTRMRISGILQSFLEFRGYREIQAWHDDLIFYTCVDGVLISNAKTVSRKIKPPAWKRLGKKKLAELNAATIADDLKISCEDNERDIESED